jgi:hypothetical protein
MLHISNTFTYVSFNLFHSITDHEWKCFVAAACALIRAFLFQHNDGRVRIWETSSFSLPQDYIIGVGFAVHSLSATRVHASL